MQLAVIEKWMQSANKGCLGHKASLKTRIENMHDSRQKDFNQLKHFL